MRGGHSRHWELLPWLEFDNGLVAVDRPYAGLGGGLHAGPGHVAADLIDPLPRFGDIV